MGPKMWRARRGYCYSSTHLLLRKLLGKPLIAIALQTCPVNIGKT